MGNTAEYIMFNPRPNLVTPILEKVSENSIEEGIRPLVDALNNKGYKTIASCEGHVAYGPYVFFKMPDSKIVNVIGNTKQRDDRSCITFNPLFYISWENNEYHGRTGVIRWLSRSKWHMEYTREEVDMEIKKIADRINNIDFSMVVSNEEEFVFRVLEMREQETSLYSPIGDN